MLLGTLIGKTMTLNYFSILLIALIIVVPLLIWHFKNKSAVYRICFTLISFGIIAIIIACNHRNLGLHIGVWLTFMIGGIVMIILPLAVLLFHNLQKDRLQQMIKDEIANELNQMKAKDL